MIDLENLLISASDNVTDNHLQRLKFSFLTQSIKQNPVMKTKMERVRSIKDDYIRQEVKKKELPYFNMGQFKDNIRRNSNLESMQFMTFDFDELSEDEYKLVYNGLLKDERTFMLFHSASGGFRFKVIFALEKPLTSCVEYTFNYKHYFNELEVKFNVKIDYAPDAQRGSYLSYDEDLYVNPDCKQLPVIEYKETAKKEVPEGGEFSDTTNLAEAAEFLRHKIDCYHDYKITALALASLGEDGREYFLKICSNNPNYSNDTDEKLTREFNAFLKSYNQDKSNRIRINSLFYLAKQKGFTFPVKKFSYTEQGGADMLAYYFSHEIKYCEQNKTWYIWDGIRWKVDYVQQIRDYIRSLIKLLYERASGLKDRDKIRLLKYIRFCQKRRTQDNILALAKAHEKIRILAEKFDAGKVLFNCLNGTIDLTNKELSFSQHDGCDLLTKSAPVNINQRAQSPKWLAFMDKIFLGDQELIEFVQKALGYSMTGLSTEQCFFLMIGNGANGKSTFIETIQTLFGNYATKAAFQLVTPKKDGSIRNDVARIHNYRMVVTSEPKEGIKFDEAILKDFTGGDTIAARFLFNEEFCFKPMFKLWMYGNHKPVIKETDKGIYRRIKIIPFDYTFQDSEKRSQEEIMDEFLAEADGILMWMLEGFYKWKLYGLQPPEKVQKATNEYFEEMDFIQNFINECCDVYPAEKESLREVYKYFANYSKDQGEYVISQRQFSSKLKMKGYNNYKGTLGFTFVKGLKIKTDVKTQFDFNNESARYNHHDD